MSECPLSPSIQADRDRVNRELVSILDTYAAAGCGPVAEAMRYAVLGPGQRMRPILALRAARTLGVEESTVVGCAGAVELLHCASLIVDDLPCMDNESERRGRPAVHLAFGEATALLAAFSLVALSARLAIRQPDFQCRLLRTLDLSGLVGGQSLDLSLCGEVRESNRIPLHELKTVPLFTLAAAAAGPEPALHEFARHFGVGFQLVDDYLDGELQDLEPVTQRLGRARRALQSFGASAHPLEELIDTLHARALAHHHCHR
jgi:geranylgeranyl pyrophosphate synthase